MTVEILVDPFRTWTVHDLAPLPDGPRYEIVDGRLEMAPGPSGEHVGAAYRLMRLLQAAAPVGVGILMEGHVVFSESSYRVADVGVFRESALSEPPRVGMRASDFLLVAEVMSPSSVTTDRVTKPEQYAAAGIPHYWRLEPAARLLIAYDLRDGHYVEVARATGPDRLQVIAPFPFATTPDALLGESADG